MSLTSTTGTLESEIAVLQSLRVEGERGSRTYLSGKQGESGGIGSLRAPGDHLRQIGHMRLAVLAGAGVRNRGSRGPVSRREDRFLAGREGDHRAEMADPAEGVGEHPTERTQTSVREGA
jgi:hypothetical protein